MEAKDKDEQIEDVKNILESQAMIDELLVKNSDDTALIKNKKRKLKNTLKQLKMKKRFELVLQATQLIDA